MKKILQFPYMIGAFIIILMASSLLLVNAEEANVTKPLKIAINDGLLQYTTTQDEWITLIGVDQLRGEDGTGIIDVSLADNGHLYISLTNDELVDLGKITADDGDDGLGVEEVIIENNHLVITYTDGESIDLGQVIGPMGPEGPRGLQGLQGEAGSDGVTPHIGENGNWHIGSLDTGTYAGDNVGVTVIEIRDVDDLVAINDCLTCHYKLMNNIDLTGVEWTPLAPSGFQGVFDGNGYIINDLANSANMEYFGLFRLILDGAEIKNLQIEMDDEYISGANSGLLAAQIVGDGNSTVTINNLEFDINDPVTVGDNFGFLAGNVSDAIITIDNIEISLSNDTTLNFERNAGGLVGNYEGGDLTVNNANIILDEIISSNEANIGGLVGNFEGGMGSSDVRVTNSDVEFHFNGNADNVGGLFGTMNDVLVFIDNISMLADFENSSATQNYGGLIGYVLESNIDVSDVRTEDNNIYFMGNYENAGLIIGNSFQNWNVSISNIEIEGQFFSDSSEQSPNARNVGGVIGYSEYDQYGSFMELNNMNIIIDFMNYYENTGGLIGFNRGHSVTVEDVDIVAEFGTNGEVVQNAGGFIGQSSAYGVDISGNAIHIEQYLRFDNSSVYIPDGRISGTAMGGFVGRYEAKKLISNDPYEFDDSIESSNAYLNFTNSEVRGEFYASEGKLGGFIGHAIGGVINLDDSEVFINTQFSGDNVGFVVGLVDSSMIDILRLTITGDLDGDNYLGGYIGLPINFGYHRVEHSTLLIFNPRNVTNKGNYLSANPDTVYFHEQNNYIHNGYSTGYTE